jgi:hypothetical protein
VLTRASVAPLDDEFFVDVAAQERHRVTPNSPKAPRPVEEVAG